MHKCPKCGKEMVVEAMGDGKKKIKCSPCGLSEIRDSTDRQLLTSDHDHISPSQLLFG